MGDDKPLLVRILASIPRLAALVALGTLVVEFGIADVPYPETFHAVEVGVVVVFIADVIARLGFARDKKGHFRRYWFEILVVFLIIVQGVGVWAVADGAALAQVYMVVVQGYLLLRLVVGLLRVEEAAGSRMRPAWVLVGSFLLLIAIGTGLFMLPNSQVHTRNAKVPAWGVVDALFTSTSAVCVTGLSVRDVGTTLTFKGQIVLLALIQIGGLGLPTLALFFAYLRERTMGLRQMTFVRDMLSVERVGNLGQFLGYVLVITVVAEFVGAAFLFHGFRHLGNDLGERAWWAVFHSVSAFCNAGFGLAAESLIPYAGSAAVCVPVMGLIVLGGLGFPVLFELLRFPLGALPAVRRWRWMFGGGAGGPGARLGLHTKLVLIVSAILVAGGGALFWLAEAGYVLHPKPAGQAALVSVFQSVTARTAGFNTVNIPDLQALTFMLLIVLMAIGASPVSTGGGLKTSAFGILWLTLRSMLRNREAVEAFGRTIPRGVVNATVAILVLYGSSVLLCTAALSALVPGARFLDALFESVSALSTVGLTSGVTEKSGTAARLVLCAAMLVGRVGPLAIVWTVLSRPPALRYQYPEESVVVS